MRVLASLLICLIGCGSGAIRAHATAATVAIQAELAVRHELIAGAHHAAEECRADQACLDRAAHDWTTAGAAHDLVLPALEAYRDAVLVAGQGDEESPDLRAALMAVALRLFASWESMRAALERLGVSVPSLEVPR